MSAIRVAVVGAGHLGKIHARLVKQLPEAELTAVVDPYASARDQIAAELQVAATDDYRSLLNGIDAAIVATPTHHHFSVVRDLLEAGVHVLVEKPITLSTADADQLVSLADDRHAVLQVGHVERFNPAFTAAQQHLAEPKYIDAVRNGPYSCRSTDVGVVLDLMIHDIDIVLSLVRDHLVDVQALGAAVFGPHEDWAQARLTFANGCVANLAASRVAIQPQRAMQVYTHDGFVTLDFAARRAKVMRPSAAVLRGEVDVNTLSPDEKTQLKERLFIDYLPVEELSAFETNAILEEQRDFLAAIRTGQPVRVSGRDGRDALAVAEQIVKALASHAWDGDEKFNGLRFDDAQPVRRGPHWHQAQPAPSRRMAG